MYARIAVAAAGTNTIVAAPASGSKIVVTGLVARCGLATAALFRSGPSTTLMGTITFLAGGALDLQMALLGDYVFELGDGEALVLVTSGLTCDINGGVWYQVVPAH